MSYFDVCNEPPFFPFFMLVRDNLRLRLARVSTLHFLILRILDSSFRLVREQ